ncbi:MAG: hypothetical protein AAF597_19725 [Bacteroidota bacterium]
MFSQNNDRWTVTTTLLRLSTTGVCFGLGVIALVYDLPVRELLWDESWWSWFANGLGYSWTAWVTSAGVDHKISCFVKGVGVGLLVCGIAALLLKRPGKFLWVVFVFLLLQHLLEFKSHFWQLGQLLELCLQTSAPLLLYWWIVQGRTSSANRAGAFRRQSFFWLTVRILIALTFVGHGLYAVGLYPVPANFILMTQAGVGLSEATARRLLLTVGILDFLAAALLLLPKRQSQLMALWWIIPWAILTSLARIWSYGSLVTTETLLWQWLPETVRRLPHVLIPLASWLRLRATDENPA